jgi:hypothetical protein
LPKLFLTVYHWSRPFLVRPQEQASLRYNGRIFLVIYISPDILWGVSIEGPVHHIRLHREVPSELRVSLFLKSDLRVNFCFKSQVSIKNNCPVV